MKTAIVHEWLTTYAGSERVLEQMLVLYPEADLYTLMDHLPKNERHGIPASTRTSFLQHMPFARTHYRMYLPLMPLAIEQFNLSHYDLILSSSHAVAKGVNKQPGQVHICYCHTPMRYAWDLRDQYLADSHLDRGIRGYAARSILDWLRQWDLSTASRVDHFIANSRYIAERIKRAYRREAAVIYPPVDTDSFTLAEEKEDYFLAASRIVPYKKMDLIVRAFTALPNLRLKVVGDGPGLHTLRHLAGSNIEILGYQEDYVLRRLMQRAQALIFAAEEDFGIIPVEAQACGTPVIAYGKGGATETILPLASSADKEPTGIFFAEQTVESLINTIRTFLANRDRFNPKLIRKNAERFSKVRFRNELFSFVADRTRSVLT